MAPRRTDPNPAATPSPVSDDEVNAELDRILGGTPTPNAAPAASATAGPTYTAPGTPAATGGRTVKGPKGETIAIPADAPAGIEEYVAKHGAPSSWTPGRFKEDTKDGVTGEVTKAGSSRYVWSDGFKLDVDSTGTIANSTGGPSAAAATPKATYKDVVENGRIVRKVIDPVTQQPTGVESDLGPAPVAAAAKPPAQQSVNADPTAENLTTFDPATGQYSAQKNPGYSQNAAALDNANNMLKLEEARIRAAQARGEIGVDQAKVMYQTAKDALSNWYTQKKMEQDAYESDMSGARTTAQMGTSLLGQSLQYMVPKGWGKSMNGALGAVASGKGAPEGGFGDVMTTPFPFNPMTLPQETAMANYKQNAAQRPSYQAPQALLDGVYQNGQKIGSAVGQQAAAVAAVPQGNQLPAQPPPPAEPPPYQPWTGARIQ